MARAQAKAVGAVERLNGAQRGSVIGERLAHAHENDVGHVLVRGVEQSREVQYLLDNLARREVAPEALLAGGAEAARHGAASLGGDANCVAPAAVLGGLI